MTRVLIICLAGYPGPNQEWTHLGAPESACGASELGVANAEGGAFWRELVSVPECRDISPRLGLVSYPAELPGCLQPKVLVPCSLHGNPNQCALPPELRGDLGDFDDGCTGTIRVKSHKDPEQIFAEQAAAARIVREHTLRLALKYRPEVLAVGFNGLAVIKRTKGMPMGFDSFYAAQIAAHARAMASQLGLDKLFFITEGLGSKPPMAVLCSGNHQNVMRAEAISAGEFWRLAAVLATDG